MHKHDVLRSAMKVFKLFVLCVFSIAILASCSAVFKAGLSGTVRDAESTEDPKEGIANVSVYAYTIESARDTDFTSWQAGTQTVGYSDSYVGRTTTADDGTFTINRMVWHTTAPAFGKTADYRDIHLIYHHDDYGLQKNAVPVTVISDSTNANAVAEELTKSSMIVDLEIEVLDVATDAAMVQDVTIRTSVDQGIAGSDDDQVRESVVTGTGTVTVSYPRSMASSPVAVVASYRNGSTWIQCTEDGSAVDTAVGVASTALTDNPTELTIYMKNTRHDFPTISGQCRIKYLAGDDSKLFSDDDDLAIWLGQRSDAGKIVLYGDEAAETLTYAEGDGSNSQLISHGLFAGLGSGMQWDDSTYAGTTAYLDVMVVVDADNGRTLTTGDRYRTVRIYNTTGTKNLGAMTTVNTTAVVAADLP